MGRGGGRGQVPGPASPRAPCNFGLDRGTSQSSPIFGQNEHDGPKSGQIMGNFVMHQDKLALLTPKRLVIHHTLLPVHQNNEKNDNNNHTTTQQPQQPHNHKTTTTTTQ